jgi:hypothetical protein
VESFDDCCTESTLDRATKVRVSETYPMNVRIQFLQATGAQNSLGVKFDLGGFLAWWTLGRWALESQISLFTIAEVEV